MNLNRKMLIEEIKNLYNCEKFLRDSKNNMKNCPFCGSGSGPNGTGAIRLYDTNTFYCFSCHKYGDIFDLIQNEYNVDFNEALRIASLDMNLPFLSSNNDFPSKNDKYVEKDEKTSNRPIPVDFKAYYEVCKRNLLENQDAISYLSERGISKEIAISHNIGFDPNSDPAHSGYTSPRLIIPTNDFHYIGRSIDNKVDKKFAKLNVKGAKAGIFNLSVLYEGHDVIFVTEGVFDALSVIELGYKSISLNSTSNVDLLLRELELRRTYSFLIISLDNDKSGKDSSILLSKGLNRLNINNTIENISGKYKDPNEALISDRKSFGINLNSAKLRASSKPDNVKSYVDFFMQKEIDDLLCLKDRKTGFPSLDAMSGGLYPGLYVIAATSSLGKTTFVHQIADNLSTNGNDVLFFSMEQSRLELVSKSIARIIAQSDSDSNITSLSIRKGFVNDKVLESMKIYNDLVSDRLSIIEGNFNLDVTYIGDYVHRYVKNNSCNPIVIVDYLQILKPSDKFGSSKEIIDNNVSELKRISIENNLTLLVISSVNRTNYLTPIDFESLKESGGIEYTSDVIWGLQLQCLNESLFSEANKIKDKRERIRIAKSSNPRKIELICLKNRYGVSNYQCSFDYYPKNDLFIQSKKDFDSYVVSRRI